MSKSLGNAINPQDVIKQSGADILRLWVSMSDYQEETRVSKEILARVAEAYRKIRNTLRYLLSNLYDFDPVRDAVERTHMEEVDRYILARYGDLARKILSAYEAYDYSTIFQAVNAFITVDLSAFYADVSKDRLYTFAAGSKERRSAQTAMFVMTDGLARLLAPILSFSMEELWRYLPGKREESVHLALFPPAGEIEPLVDRNLLDTWEHLLRIRTTVNASLELLRKDKQIGTSLEARVHITASGEDFALLQRYEKQLPMLFIVSEVVVERAERATGCDSRAGHRREPRVGHKVRALLAIRLGHVHRSGPGRHLRSLSGRAGGNRHFLMTSIRRRMPEIWIAAAIVVLDQATKAMVKFRLPLHESVTVIPGFFDFTHVRNTGAAFGMLNNMDFAFKPAVMVIVALVALGAVASYALTLPATQRIARYGLALILGGAIGNLIDRATMGYVVDFVDVYWRGVHFWAFNVADSAITVGVALMLLDVLGVGRVPETV